MILAWASPFNPYTAMGDYIRQKLPKRSLLWSPSKFLKKKKKFFFFFKFFFSLSFDGVFLFAL